MARRRDFQQTAKLVGLFFISLMMSNGLSANGDILFRDQCSHCHSLEAGSGTGIGPSLSALTGQSESPVASAEGFDYSAALKEKSTEGMTWNSDALDHFLLSPAGTIPGTKMTYPGMASAESRALLIQWLQAPDSRSSGDINPEVERILAASADPAYGEYLASECVTCHSGTSSGGGVPPIDNLPAAYFIQALLDYKTGARTNQVMKLMTDNLGDEELVSLAVFFSPAD
ncbi:MAG: hypothetical protein KTR32_15925 [Granulosicoccus sp.]|nr:hypothetical protein [Granulosicoccus sp.]